MCIHRDQYDAGVAGDQEYVTDLTKNYNFPTAQAAATLFQRKIDAGQRLTTAVVNAVWDDAYEAAEKGTPAELVA